MIFILICTFFIYFPSLWGHFSHYSVIVANSKIYQKENNLDGNAHIAILSAETGHTLTTLNLNLTGLIRLHEPKDRVVHDEVKWIAVWASQSGHKEQILLLDLESNDVRPVCQVIKDISCEFFTFQAIKVSKDFFFTIDCLEEDENSPTDMTPKLYRIPSGELLVEERDTNIDLHYEEDLGEGTIHVWKQGFPPPAGWTIASFSSSSEPPKYVFADQQRHQQRRPKNVCNGRNVITTSVIYSCFVLANTEKGVVSLTVEPFGAGSEAKSRKNWKRNLSLETEEVLYVPQMHIMRSKAILAVGHQDSAELVLLDFAI